MKPRFRISFPHGAVTSWYMQEMGLGLSGVGHYSNNMLSGCNLRVRSGPHTSQYVLPSVSPIDVRMLSDDTCLLNVYQMTAGHCLLFLVNRDKYRGAVLLHLARSVSPAGSCWSAAMVARLVILCLPLGNRTGPCSVSETPFPL